MTFFKLINISVSDNFMNFLKILPIHYVHILIKKLFCVSGIPIKEFVGLRPKMYSLVYEEKGNLKEKKTAKGVKTSAIRTQLRHSHYKHCLFNNDWTINSMKIINSKDHELYVNHTIK